MRISTQKHPDGAESRLGWLIARADYLALQVKSSAIKYSHTPFFTIQARPTTQASHTVSGHAAVSCDWRVGLTTSKRVGNAVARNRARRRLRDLARRHIPLLMQPGYDLVLVGRAPAATAPFPLLVESLAMALGKMRLSTNAADGRTVRP